LSGVNTAASAKRHRRIIFPQLEICLAPGRSRSVGIAPHGVTRARDHNECGALGDRLSTTPYLAALDRRRRYRRRPDQAKPTSSSVAPTARAPSSPRTGI
jgi:hypothetical protein